MAQLRVAAHRHGHQLPFRVIDGFHGSKVAVADDDPGQPRCATPTISVINGKLHFDCETPDVEFVYTCTFNSTSELNEEVANDIPLDTNYTVTVYAKKAGLGNSETVSKQIDVRSRQGDVNQDGKVTISDAVGVVNILLGQ